MYSVILTELGISVFNDKKHEKSFAFSDNVKEYLAVKNKEAKLNELVNYLSSIQRVVSVSDESLLVILKKYSVDCYLMKASELETIQITKSQIIVDSGFASSLQDTLGKLREFALGLSSSIVTKVSESQDLHIIQAVNTLDEIDKMANALSSRLREWYGLHFPELENIIDSINGYAQIVMAGKRESMTKQVFEDAGFPDSKVEMLSLISSKSRGGDISDDSLVIVQSIAKQILDFHDLRKKLEEHVESEMVSIAPNLSAILGGAVGARILGRAGGLKKFASFPASTIQVLGAEKALFRSLKTGSQPPKHGLLFQHAMVHSAPRWQRGKIARAVAAKAVIAARVDVYGEGLNETLLEKLNIRIDEIGKKYKNPTEKDTRDESFIRDDRGKGYSRDDRGKGYSRDDRGKGYSRDDRGKGYSRDDRGKGYSRDDRGKGYSRDDRGKGYSRDDRGKGYSRDDRGKGYSRDDRGKGYSRDDRGKGYSRDDRGKGYSRDDRGKGYSRDDRGKGYSRDDRGKGYSKDDRGKGYSRDDRGKGYSRDDRGKGYSRDDRGKGYSRDDRGKGYSRDDRGKGYSKDDRGKGYSKDDRGKGYSKDDRGKGYSKDDRGKGYSKDDRGKGYSKDDRGKGYSKDDRGKGYSKDDRGKGGGDERYKERSGSKNKKRKKFGRR